MSSSSTQDQINKAKTTRDNRLVVVFVGGTMYAIMAILIPNELLWVSPII